MKRILVLASVLILCSAFVSSSCQLIKTQLFVTVIDEIGNIQPGATVVLYETKEDYEKGTNPIYPKKKKADKKGRVRFLGLEKTDYYILSKKGKKDNTLGGEKVKGLHKGKMNRVNVVIE